MLRRMVDQIAALFKREKTTVEVMLNNGSTKTMSRIEAYEHYVKRAFEVLQTDNLRNLEEGA